MNAALDLLGEEPLPDLETSSPRQKVALRQWPFALKQILRAAPWSWAKAREILEPDEDGPPFGWKNRFELPEGFVTLLMLNRRVPGQPGRWWEIESGWLLSDESEALIEFIAMPAEEDEDDLLERMDPLAMAAFQLLLASKIAPKIVQDGLTMSNNLMGRYLSSELPRALVRMANERKSVPPQLIPDSVGDQSRYFGTAG